MKTKATSIFLLIHLYSVGFGQNPSTVDPVIEGGKIIVELVKAFSSKKENDKSQGCKNSHADLCIENGAVSSMSVFLENRTNGEKREVVVMPQGRECFLRISIGVWTYDIRMMGTLQSMRKGDMLIEGCNNMVMSIK